MNKNHLRGSLCCVLAALIWGVAFVAQVAGMDHVGPFTFLGLRCWLAAAVLAPLALRGRAGKAPASSADRRALWGAGILCGLCLYTASAFQQYGLQYTTAGKSGFITALYVVLVPLARLLTGRRPPLLLWICAALAAAGLWLLCMTPGQAGFNPGDLLTLICALIFTCHILLLDHFSPRFSSVQLSCIQFLTGGVIGVPIFLLTEGFCWQDVAGAALPILYAGILSSGVAYTLQAYAQKNTDPTVASILLCLESVFSVLASWVLLGQALSGRELAGCGVMFAAILLAQLPAAQKTDPARGNGSAA